MAADNLNWMHFGPAANEDVLNDVILSFTENKPCSSGHDSLQLIELVTRATN